MARNNEQRTQTVGNIASSGSRVAESVADRAAFLSIGCRFAKAELNVWILLQI